MLKRIYHFLIPVLVLSAAIGCSGGGEGSANDGKLKVVATTGMVASTAETVAGDKINLTALMGPGVDPHLYKATKGDIDRLGEADLILYNGLFLEAKMAEIFEKMSSSKSTVAVAETVPDSLLKHDETFGAHPDPHIWFDVALWKTAVSEIAGALASSDSANSEYYMKNAEACLDSLDALHAWVTEQIGSIPEGQRILVTAHDAFGYFGDAYGIEVRGLQGISTVTEAGLYDVTDLIDMLVDLKVKAVFVESSVPKKSIEAVVEGCRSRGHEIIIGGELFSDAMGEEGTPEGTYFGMVRHNVNTIVSALK